MKKTTGAVSSHRSAQRMNPTSMLYLSRHRSAGTAMGAPSFLTTFLPEEPLIVTWRLSMSTICDPARLSLVYRTEFGPTSDRLRTDFRPTLAGGWWAVDVGRRDGRIGCGMWSVGGHSIRAAAPKSSRSQAEAEPKPSRNRAEAELKSSRNRADTGPTPGRFPSPHRAAAAGCAPVHQTAIPSGTTAASISRSNNHAAR